MGLFTGAVLYLLIWWTVLFAVLPIGVRPESRPDPVSGLRGAPRSPRLVRVAMITTLVSLVIWGGAMLVIRSPMLSFRQGALSVRPL